MAAAAASGGVVDRDHLIRDVLAEIDEDDRGEVVDFCLKQIPNNVAFIDGVIVVSVYVQMGFVDVQYDELDFDFTHIYYKVDEAGRITMIDIDPEDIGCGSNDDADPYDLPSGIARLEKLVDLRIRPPCRSLPAELANLLHLEVLRFYGCSGLLENDLLPRMDLPWLKVLYVSFCRFRPASPVFAWMARRLPKLEVISFHCMERDQTDRTLDALRDLDDGAGFRGNLKSIVFCNCKVDNVLLEKVLATTLTKFPNLPSLDLPNNNIQSLRPIVAKIKNGDHGVEALPKTIRTLVLRSNPIMDNAKNDPKEKTALLGFLRFFDNISSLNTHATSPYDPDVEYAMRINHAGRRIVEGGGDGSSSRRRHRDRSLPPSLWPAVLERAHKHSDHVYHKESSLRGTNATGLFYLLREKLPALVGSPVFGNDRSRRTGGGGGDDREQKIPSKRKLEGENEAHARDNQWKRPARDGQFLFP